MRSSKNGMQYSDLSSTIPAISIPIGGCNALRLVGRQDSNDGEERNKDAESRMSPTEQTREKRTLRIFM